MDEYISNILELYNNQIKTIETLSTSLQEANANNYTLKEMLAVANDKIILLNKDIKLKDSRIAAYERSSKNLGKSADKSDGIQIPNIPQPKSPKRIDTIKPENTANLPNQEELNTTESNSIIPSSEILQRDDAADAADNADDDDADDADEYTIITLDNSTDEELSKTPECYFIENETRNLYLITSTKTLGEMVGQLKTFKTKAGTLYILNNYTNRVYHTNEANEIFSYCGNIINKKLKLI